MNTSILTQKNVCAFLGLIMALTIVFSASAQENKVLGEQLTAVLANEITEEKEALEMIVNVELPELKAEPIATFINKQGEVIAEFYGEKSDLEIKFSELFKKCKFLTASGKQEFYLVS
ncbi:hypothetical protein Belba_1047 [Belliella baltica DSM 15883]|uniref:Uncharacterized protein n=1 Tax=Belliella baltica (strain DSM 15883 / CIP 108006 / LMG 21964 / BA134) TaxID=866536 RepID=I3Z368_BELBD|nr:hypothetical protein [Belliella baltica]AFL83686.1 hypothetical protein Belba_1047 [Belliella baltica DSM 15883]